MSMFSCTLQHSMLAAAVSFILVAPLGGSNESQPPSPVAPGGNPILVPLTKLTVPVRKGGKVVSYKQSFAGEIAIGSAHHGAQQEFSIIFDSGSGNVVVPDERCGSNSCLAHRRYDISKSRTPSASAINMDGSVPVTHRDEAEIRFGTGTVRGQFVREALCVGAGRPADRQICVEMSILAAQAMSDNPFLEFQFDGIVGLGLEGLAVAKEFSFLNRLAEQTGRFQFAMYRAPSDRDSGHELAIGGYNHRRFTGGLQWTEAIEAEKGFWQVRIRGVRIGDQALDVCNVEGGCPGILDTGSSHLGVPKAWTQHITTALTGSPGDSTDCRDIDTPDMHLDFDGFSLTLSTRDYMRNLPMAVPGSGDARAPQPTACIPKVTPVFIPTAFGNGNFFILGEPVFSRYYTVFEWDKPRVGFAKARHAEEASEDGGAEMDDDDDAILFVQLSIEMNARRSSALAPSAEAAA